MAQSSRDPRIALSREPRCGGSDHLTCVPQDRLAWQQATSDVERNRSAAVLGRNSAGLGVSKCQPSTCLVWCRVASGGVERERCFDLPAHTHSYNLQDSYTPLLSIYPPGLISTCREDTAAPGQSWRLHSQRQRQDAAAVNGRRGGQARQPRLVLGHRARAGLRRDRVPARPPGRRGRHPQTRRRGRHALVRARPPARHAGPVPRPVQAPGAGGHEHGGVGAEGGRARGGPAGGRAGAAPARQRDAPAGAVLQPRRLRGRGAACHEEDGVGVLLQRSGRRDCTAPLRERAREFETETETELAG